MKNSQAIVLFSIFIGLCFLSSCDLFSGILNDSDNGEDNTAELQFTPDVPQISGEDSRININGMVDGESFSFYWDFSSAGSVTTNGLMSSQISSTIPGTASLYFDNDFNSSDHAQGVNDWYLRFTLGNASTEYDIYNSKETFSIPQRPYSMITLRKGPSGTEFRHREYDSQNLISIIVISSEYDEVTNTLRIAGGMKSAWGNDWVTADFNVLVGGPDDRQASLNQSTFQNSFE